MKKLTDVNSDNGRNLDVIIDYHMQPVENENFEIVYTDLENGIAKHKAKPDEVIIMYPFNDGLIIPVIIKALSIKNLASEISEIEKIESEEVVDI